MQGTLEVARELRFQIVGALGKGGFGAVYEAVDPRTGQHVAVKELHDVRGENIARFKQEFRALSDCHHANLVGLKELIEHEGRWLIIMELVPGVDLLSYVRGSAANDNASVDLTRLRTALRGVASGLSALHAYGVLHRDLKPSNVLVTEQGRAVLLDFGLVTSVDPLRQSTQVMTLGTVPYMAPEQATDKNIGPAADWYAFGVCLFEALTGRRPFDGDTPFQILADKQENEAPRASSLIPEVPEELDELCARLLERDPTRRAGVEDVLATLGERADSIPPSQLGMTTGISFTGREAELMQLSRALARTREGEMRIVLVEGESGVGKTELVGEFERRAHTQSSELLVLHGRCYENEQVTYKAFDGCIDTLAKFLSRLGERECAELLPPRAALLGQLFPVLRTVRAIAKAPFGDLSADPTARRLEAFDALAGLLRRIAEERELLLVIDDLQWADAESFRLLLALSEHAEAPPMLVVGTIRPPEELDAVASAGIEALGKKRRIDVVQLLGLPQVEAEALALQLLGSGVGAIQLRRIAEESGGHPLFLSELVQYMHSREFTRPGALSLEAALSTRIERLSPQARDLLELVALAGRPHGRHTFARALGVSQVDDAARGLLASKLLRVRKGQELGCYHDRIRHTAVSMIAKSRIPALHARLAHALAGDPHSDAMELARHWDLAGERERAAAAYERAGESALAALAFTGAAKLFERAIALLGDDGDARIAKLIARQADALACAGLSNEAADLYEQAHARASAETRIALRGRYAEQLLLAGKLTLGLAEMRGLLKELGVRVPRSTAGIVLHLLWLRLWLALRPLAINPGGAEVKEDARHTLTLNLLRRFGDALVPIHPPARQLLVLHGALRSLRIPTTALLARWYYLRGWLCCIGGSLRAADPLFERGKALSLEAKSPVVTAQCEAIEGAGRVLACDFQQGGACLERAQLLLQTHCAEEPWLLRNVRFQLGLAWYLTLQHGRLARESSRWIAEAKERNDRVAHAMLDGLAHGFVRYLMRDEPEQVVAEFETLMPMLPSKPVSYVHVGELFAMVNALLYRGGPAALSWLDARLSAFPRSLVLSRSVRYNLGLYRGIAALHAHQCKSDKREQAALRRATRRSVRQVMASGDGFLQAQGLLVLAQIEMLEGNSAQALQHAREAARAAEGRAELHVRFGHLLAAYIESGTIEDPRCREVIAILRAEGWRNPLRFVRALLPLVRDAQDEARANPKLVGRYEVVGTLGSGNSAMVEARELNTDRRVALKELVQENPRALERFKREFRAIRELYHHNLVRLDALFEQNGRWYIAMERIEGSDWLAYVRPEGKLDRERLCGTMIGVCEGLAALHEAGLVHRDLRPEHVRINAEGRPVLFDFRFIARADDGANDLGDTLSDYAAPEQLAGAPPTAAVDVYSLGVCLQVALTGSAPQRDAGLGDVATLVQFGSDELARLASRMRAEIPELRPTLAEVRSELSALSRELAPQLALPEVKESRHFLGRERELSLLTDAFEATCDDGLMLAVVEGESGIGKSALLEAFVRGIETRYPHALVLRSRCYAAEQLALKVFDGAIDQLAERLRELPNPDCEALLPKRAALLGQLFAVLNSVPSIARAPKKGLAADPTLRKAEAIACFVQLLHNLSQKFELVFVVDDLQWADGESLALLETLLARRTELPMFIASTLRPSEEVPPEIAPALRSLREHAATQCIQLSGLSLDAGASLAQRLYGAPLADARVEVLLRESKGHPLFLRELVAQERSGPLEEGALTLDVAMRRCIDALDDDAQTLLSLAALAGRPYGAHVFARATNRREPPRAAMVALLTRGLLRRSGLDELEPYHDRVAAAALERLTPERRSAFATQLAAALESEPDVEPSERARLWDEAKDRERAGRAYDEAAERAVRALQFTRAAKHLERALELSDPDSAVRKDLTVRLAEVWASAGASARAAELFEQAAERAQGDAAIRLRIRLAEQLIHSGQAAEALRITHALLRELDLPTASGGYHSTVLRLLGARALARLRGYERRGNERAPDPRRAMQLEAAWVLAQPLAWLDPLGSALLTTRHLTLALGSSDGSHLTRALSLEAVGRVIRGSSSALARPLMDRAHALARQLEKPAIDAELHYREGLVANFSSEFARAVEHLERALEIAREECPDQPWLLTTVRVSLSTAWSHCGHHARMHAECGAWLREAQERGDRFAVATLIGTGSGYLSWLMRDEPSALMRELEQNARDWPEEPYSFVHLGDLLARATCGLYEGGDRALRELEKERPRMRTASLLQAGRGRETFLSLSALAELAASAKVDSARASAHLASARSYLRKLNAAGGAHVLHVAPLIEAQLHAGAGDRERAIAVAERACEHAVASGFPLQEHRARYLVATLRGGESARRERRKLLEIYAKEGWKRPRSVFLLACPLLAQLEPDGAELEREVSPCA